MTMLVYGSYPDVFSKDNFNERKENSFEITRSYLYKELLNLANVKYPYKLKQLVKLLAYQIDSTISINELAKNASLNFDTVERYLDLPE